MSRAYRIRVRETLRRDLAAEDQITSQLELLEILPCEEMEALLAAELEQRGFENQQGLLVRSRDGVTVTIDSKVGTVTVQAEAREQIVLEGHREGVGYDDIGPGRKSVEQTLKQEVQADLEKRAEQQQARLQTKATDKLEGHLNDLQQELNQAVNRVTAEALKRKAAQLGEIKEIQEDPQTGSLSITLEV